MRILIDACLPVELKAFLEGREVKTARDMGWQRLDNGQLLSKADGHFDVLITMDKSMPSQQLLERHSIGVIIVKARSNRIADLKPLVAQSRARSAAVLVARRRHCHSQIILDDACRLLVMSSHSRSQPLITACHAVARRFQGVGGTTGS